MLFATLLLFTACSFRSLHDAHEEQLNIRVNNINFKDSIENELIHFHLKKALIDEIQGDSSSNYTLDVDFASQEYSVNIQSDYYTARSAYRLIAKIKIYENNKEKPIYVDTITVSDSYEIGSSPFTGYVSKERLGVLLAHNIAKNIKIQILHFFQDR
jgi:hypothetical protein